MRWIAFLPATFISAAFLYWLILFGLSVMLDWLPRGPVRDLIGMLWAWISPLVLGWLVILLIWIALLLLGRGLVRGRP